MSFAKIENNLVNKTMISSTTALPPLAVLFECTRWYSTVRNQRVAAPNRASAAAPTNPLRPLAMAALLFVADAAALVAVLVPDEVRVTPTASHRPRAVAKAVFKSSPVHALLIQAVEDETNLSFLHKQRLSVAEQPP